MGVAEKTSFIIVIIFSTVIISEISQNIRIHMEDVGNNPIHID